ncbi:hypothetical protein CLPUN_11660 [Clostridium puniceum]|uniref:Lipoprotein n=1 Tax=Clostridium puniceum TaxID=29367 RepID=A0A1S8TTD5_9CLOT|nr:hypothetical protein [Clostridium puniceum]OOM81006.1 hypothetical protein CLPUN_11660 [Clostridium puniceum]
MYLKKKGTVLISTMIILYLMSMLGCFMFRMMKNNLEITSLYNFDKDRYDLDKSEEEILSKFMTEINRTISKANKENAEDENIFSEDFKKNIEDNILEYYKVKDKLFLKTHKDNEVNRTREIKYFFRDEKLILVPTYKFQDDDEQN